MCLAVHVGVKNGSVIKLMLWESGPTVVHRDVLIFDLRRQLMQMIAKKQSIIVQSRLLQSYNYFLMMGMQASWIVFFTFKKKKQLRTKQKTIVMRSETSNLISFWWVTQPLLEYRWTGCQNWVENWKHTFCWQCSPYSAWRRNWR